MGVAEKKKGVKKICSDVAVGLVSEQCPVDARDKIPPPHSPHHPPPPPL